MDTSVVVIPDPEHLLAPPGQSPLHDVMQVMKHRKL